MSEVRPSITNFITIGLMAYVGVWLVNKALDKAGKPQWKA